jgi:hypothetical protein
MKKRAKATDKPARMLHDLTQSHSSSPYMGGSLREAAFGQPLFFQASR